MNDGAESGDQVCLLSHRYNRRFVYGEQLLFCRLTQILKRFRDERLRPSLAEIPLAVELQSGRFENACQAAHRDLFAPRPSIPFGPELPPYPVPITGAVRHKNQHVAAAPGAHASNEICLFFKGIMLKNAGIENKVEFGFGGVGEIVLDELSGQILTFKDAPRIVERFRRKVEQGCLKAGVPGYREALPCRAAASLESPAAIWQ